MPQAESRVTDSKDAKASNMGRIVGSRGLMFALLFGVTGFLGLPFLWLSPVFSKAEKIVWSVVVSIYTLILIGLCLWVCWWAFNRIVGAG